MTTNKTSSFKQFTAAIILGSLCLAAGPAEKLSVIKTLPEFSLQRAEDGKAFKRDDLIGKYWVVSFFFSRCEHVCPFILGKQARLQKQFSANEKLNFLSITTDPAHDKPEVLRSYAGKFSADPKRWFFLTGSQDAVVELVQKGFLLPVSKDNPAMHSAKFALVNPKGAIIGFFDSDDSTKLQDLEKILASIK